MDLYKTYNIPVTSDDFNQNFHDTKTLIRRLMVRLMRKFGSMKCRIVVELLMEKQEQNVVKAAFRTVLTPVPFISSLDEILQSKINKLIENIDGFNKNGFSGATVKRILSVSVLVIRYAF